MFLSRLSIYTALFASKYGNECFLSEVPPGGEGRPESGQTARHRIQSRAKNVERSPLLRPLQGSCLLAYTARPADQRNVSSRRRNYCCQLCTNVGTWSVREHTKMTKRTRPIPFSREISDPGMYTSRGCTRVCLQYFNIVLILTRFPPNPLNCCANERTRCLRFILVKPEVKHPLSVLSTDQLRRTMRRGCRKKTRRPRRRPAKPRLRARPARANQTLTPPSSPRQL